MLKTHILYDSEGDYVGKSWRCYCGRDLESYKGSDVSCCCGRLFNSQAQLLQDPRLWEEAEEY